MPKTSRAGHVVSLLGALALVVGTLAPALPTVADERLPAPSYAALTATLSDDEQGPQAMASSYAASRVVWERRTQDLGNVSKTFLPKFTFDTPVSIQNPNGEPVEVTIDTFDPSGRRLRNKVVSIPPRGTLVYDSSEGNDAPGSAVLTAAKPVNAVVHQNDSTRNRQAFVGVTQGLNKLYAPLVFNTKWNSTIFLQNTSDQPANTIIRYFPATGGANPITEQITIPPLGSRDVRQDDHIVPAGFVGSAVIESSQPIAAVVSQNTDESAAATAYNTVGEGAMELSLPLIMRRNAGWSTGVQVQNLGTQAEPVTITYTSSKDGSTVTQSATIAPSASFTFFQPQTPGLPDGFVGSAKVIGRAGQPLTAIVNQINELPEGAGQATTYLGAATGGPNLAAPVMYKERAGWNTGLQVQNLGTTEEPVAVDYYGLDGALIFTQNETIPAGGSKTIIQQGVTGLPDYFRGSALVRSLRQAAQSDSDGLWAAQTGSAPALTAIVNEVQTPSNDRLKPCSEEKPQRTTLGPEATVQIVNRSPQTIRAYLLGDDGRRYNAQEIAPGGQGALIGNSGSRWLVANAADQCQFVYVAGRYANTVTVQQAS